MKYRAKCTWCQPLLLNMKAFKKAYYCKDEKETYIEVNSEEMAEHIESLNAAQQATFKRYNELFEYINVSK